MTRTEILSELTTEELALLIGILEFHLNKKIDRLALLVINQKIINDALTDNRINLAVKNPDALHNLLILFKLKSGELKNRTKQLELLECN